MSEDLIDIFLLPGEYFVGGQQFRIRTLLGSCVSITLWHPLRRIGAMSHFLLSVHGSSDKAALSGRYGEDAMALMVAELGRARVDPAECQAKIFGGGVMFPGIERPGKPGIGRQNGETAERLLRQYRIPIVSENRYGVGHRHIIFNVATGDVWVRKGRAPEPLHAGRQRA